MKARRKAIRAVKKYGAACFVQGLKARPAPDQPVYRVAMMTDPSEQAIGEVIVERDGHIEMRVVRHSDTKWTVYLVDIHGNEEPVHGTLHPENDELVVG